jgi:nicotinamide phosphoribosyltransferase
MSNPLFKKDYYKAGHGPMYPDGTTLVNSNLTARNSRVKGATGVLYIGGQFWIKKMTAEWNEKFFKLPEEEAIKAYKRMMDFTLSKDAIGVDHIKALHKLGYLPIAIRAVKEGTFVPLKVPMLTIENTKPEFFWLTNFLETTMSANLWGMITSATTAKRYRDILIKAAIETGADPSFIQWQGHDFSYRGMFGDEAASMSGAAHLLTGFTGTDTIPAIEFLEKYYGADIEKELIGGSVYATEHSVMCAGGMENELETYKRLINKVYPKGILSIVSDTWDLWGVVTKHLPALKEDILARDGKVVIRPDSGDPVTILTGRIVVRSGSRFIYDQPANTWGNFCYVEGDKYYGISPAEDNETGHNRVYQIPECEVKGLVECLWDLFGGTENSKGYKVLNEKIGAIYGDSITPERAFAICGRLAHKKFASTNVVLGIGSYSYQYVTRDTYGMAIKATYCEIAGKPYEIFKDPKTDNGNKKSAKGLLAVYKNEYDGGLYLKDQATREEHENCELELVYKDGKLLREQSLSDIRKIVASYDSKETVKDVIKEKLQEMT